MPKIPAIVENRPIEAVRLPRARPEHFGAGAFRGLQTFGGTLLDIDQRNKALDEQIKHADDIVTRQSVLSDVGDKLEEAMLRLDETADHRNYLERSEEESAKIRDEAFERTKGLGREVKAQTLVDLERVLGRARVHARREQRTRALDYDRAEGMRSLENLGRLAARDPDPVGRAEWQKQGFDAIAGLVSRGALKETDAVQWVGRFKSSIEKEREGYFNTELRDQLDNLQNQALRDPFNAESYHHRGTKLIENAGADWLPPEKLDEAHSQFRSGVWSSAVKGKIGQDAQRTLQELKEGRYDDKLTQSAIIHLRGEAETEIERKQRKAEAERKERVRFVGKLVDDYEDAKMSGFDWRGPVSEGQLSQMVRGTEHEGKFRNVQQGSKILGQFNVLSPTEQEQYLRGVRTGAKSGVEAKFVGTLERAHQTAKEWLQKDPLTFAVRQRLVPPPPPLNLTDPNTLRARSKAANVAEERYGRPVSPLSDDEANQLVTMLEQAPADGKVAVFRSLRAGLEDRQIKSVAGQLGKKGDNVLALSMGLSIDAPQASSNILRGRDILRDNPKILPSGSDLQATRDRINQNLGEAYLHNPEEHAARADAALAIYAQKSWQEKDQSGVLNSKRLDASVQEATGGLLTIGGGFFRKGSKIQPPKYGMTDDQFKKLLDKADYSGAKGLSASDIKRHGILESVGEGRYLIRVGPGYVQGERGPFVLDLSGVK
jgi:hypothetical protein